MQIISFFGGGGSVLVVPFLNGKKTPKQNPIIIIAGFKFLLKVLFIGQKQ